MCDSGSYGVWFEALKRLHQHANTKPRRRSLAHQLMFEDPKAVNDAFFAHYGDGAGMSRVERLNKRYDLAKELLSTTLLYRVPDLEKRAKENHERELREWKVELESVEEAEDVHQCVSASSSFVCDLLPKTKYYIERVTPLSPQLAHSSSSSEVTRGVMLPSSPLPQTGEVVTHTFLRTCLSAAPCKATH